MSSPAASSPAPLHRRVLWGVLILALGGVVALAWWRSAPRAKELPRLAQLPEFTLTDRDGSLLSRASLAGRPWIASFIFTRCRSSCPLVTEAVMKLAASLASDGRVQFVSFTVDPEHDSPAVLEAYAGEHGIGSIATSRWHFAAGSRDALYSLIGKGFMLAVDDRPGTADEPIVHSTRLVLVDAEGAIRGYYDSRDAAALTGLARDARALASAGR